MLHKNLVLPWTLTAALALIIAACAPAATPTPIVTPSPQVTAVIPNSGGTEVASPTPTSIPTSTPTVTLTATATTLPTPTPSSTPVPTATPIPSFPSGPSIQLIYPISSTAILVGQRTVVQSAATGVSGLTHVDLWVDGALYASTPNPLAGGTSMSVTQLWIPPSAGAHTLAVVAYDALGRPSTPAVATVQVSSGAAPVAWIAQPYAPDGNIVLQAGDTVQLSYWGSAGAGVARLELWVDGTLAYSDANSTPSLMMNVQHVWSSNILGEHSLFVRAYDTLNQHNDSAPLVIGLTDRNPPSVRIVSPADHTQVAPGQTVPVSVSASDTKGITHIELWVDDLLVNSWNSAQTVGQPSANVSLAWPAPTAGAHSLYVIAKDSVGLSTSTPTILVVVGAPASTPMPTPTPMPLPASTLIPTVGP